MPRGERLRDWLHEEIAFEVCQEEIAYIVGQLDGEYYLHCVPRGERLSN